MALTNPIYNLEENLDIYLLQPFDNDKIKGHIEAIVEDDFLEDLSSIEQKWLEYINIEQNLTINTEIEIFYVVKILKKISVTIEGTTNADTEVEFPIGTKILIPQSFINTEKTTNMQLEPNTYVLDFFFDYNAVGFDDPDEMLERIKKFIATESNGQIEVTSRKVDLYKEEDLNSILRLLKIYYKIDLPSDLIDENDNKKPNSAYGDYNRNSIRNILCSATNSQIVISSSSIGDKVSISRKIEVSLAPNENRKVQCVIYNRTKYEIKTFRY